MGAGWSRALSSLEPEMTPHLAIPTRQGNTRPEDVIRPGKAGLDESKRGTAEITAAGNQNHVDESGWTRMGLDWARLEVDSGVAWPVETAKGRVRDSRCQVHRSASQHPARRSTGSPHSSLPPATTFSGLVHARPRMEQEKPQRCEAATGRERVTRASERASSSTRSVPALTQSPAEGDFVLTLAALPHNAPVELPKGVIVVDR